MKPEELGLVRATGHKTGCTADIRSDTNYTTRKTAPILFIRDKNSGKVWLVQHLPDGPYSMEVGLTDAENISGSFYNVACGAGRNEKHGFRLYLNRGERYVCCETLYGCADSLDEAMRALTAYRRRYLKKHPAAPLMFNDYMNCLWTRLDTESCFSLINCAARAGAEGYCFDDGWYRDKDVNGATHLGDWKESQKRFEGKSFRQLIEDIRAKGMMAGLWTELEVCSLLSDAAKKPASWFLTNEGHRIYRCGRLYFNFSNREVRRYLSDCIAYLYEMGIRYIKNDYNGHPGYEIDWKNAYGPASVEAHARAVHRFYGEIRKKFPGLILESCASGAMRADGRCMQNFNVQSVSDCEEYDKLPAILQGTLLHLLPEQIGIWAYPYPRIFGEMQGESYFTPQYAEERKDGRETVFNIVTGLLGNLYLSGKIDRADEYNAELIREGISLAKTLRDFVAESYPIYPLGLHTNCEKTEFLVQGLRNKKRVLLAVWRRCGEEKEVYIPMSRVAHAKEIYPDDSSFPSVEKGGIRV